MKIVHINKNAKGAKDRALVPWLKEARELESNDEPLEAAALYQKIIKAYPINETAYDRLMIIYRKEKEYNKELSVINNAIKQFEDWYGKTPRFKDDKKIYRLSRAISQSVGLTDKKGRLLYEREPIARWSKRKELVRSKLSK